MKKEALSQDGIGSTAIAIILPVQKLEKEQKWQPTLLHQTATK